MIIIGLGAGFAFMGLGILGIIAGKTLGASYHDSASSDQMEKKARLFGLVWLLVGFLILITVVFKAHIATRGGINIYGGIEIGSNRQK